MGIFDLFKGKRSNVDLAGDRIWLTKAAKTAGITREIGDCLAGADVPDAVFLVAHFEDHLEELRSLVEKATFDTSRVMVTTADALAGRNATAASLDESQTILIVGAERHPLHAHDEAITEFARTLPCQCKLVFHCSLEDPVLQVFTGDWIQDLLRTLGMPEDEAIQSHMVTRRIEHAQRRFERQVSGDLPASSAEQWLEKNLGR